MHVLFAGSTAGRFSARCSLSAVFMLMENTYLDELLEEIATGSTVLCGTCLFITF
jgi:hypothetical protein